MSPVGFEPTTPVFERAGTVHVSDRAVTVIGCLVIIHQHLSFTEIIILSFSRSKLVSPKYVTHYGMQVMIPYLN
jgi:hypothetical protein